MGAGVPVSPVAAYLVGLVLGLDADQVSWGLKLVLPPCLLLNAGVVPYLCVRWMVGRAFAIHPGEARGERMERMLRLPWHIATVVSALPWVYGGMLFALPICLHFNRSLSLVLVGGATGACIAMLLSFPIGLTVERWMLPYVLAERDEQSFARPTGRGFFWPRQSWFLPYTFAASLIATLALCGAVVTVKTIDFQKKLVQEMEEAGEHRAAQRLAGLSGSLGSDLGLPLLVVAGMFLSVPTVSAWLLARRQDRGSKAVQRAVESMSAGRLMAPEWVSTDEIGDLSAGLYGVLDQLRAIPVSLTESATKLVDAGTRLTHVNQEQRNSISSQAAALQEANVTAQEIKQTSAMAAEKADSVLVVVGRAEELGRTGADAIAQTLLGFASIRESVASIRSRVGKLESSARQIGGITETVKDLADQSNMLALNAAIEAVRSGEHGKGFGVVAREIRALADQSIRATASIRDVLQEVERSISDAVSISDIGAAQIEGGLEKVKSSGASIQEMSEIMKESSAAVRQIVAAVGQQNVGFTQIFLAIGDLSRNMDLTVSRLDTTLEAATTLENVSRQVADMARRYQVE